MPDAKASPASGKAVPEGDPVAIVGERGPRKEKFFHLVQRLAGTSKGGRCRVRLLAEGKGGLFRPSGETWCEAESALVRVRTARTPGGVFRLLTLRKRILATELLD
ncbi:hypothetical protein WJX81_004498 [Elliptochloris bilobata]|uniref:Uncharacterized protein n=1 Tax=Elliptochloris bilobata TaxID=381761 RepID=A0AAW1QJ20_9CHLO